MDRRQQRDALGVAEEIAVRFASQTAIAALAVVCLDVTLRGRDFSRSHGFADRWY